MEMIVFFGLFLLLLVLRAPVGIALLLPSLYYLVSTDGLTLDLAIQLVSGGVNSFPLLAIPLFILVGQVANHAGIADRLFDFAQALFARVRGSLAYVNVLVSFGFSWMSGAAIADAAGLGSIEVPAMRARGYPTRFSVGLTGASTIIGPIMPPSIPAIIYAVTAGVSVGGLFMAGILPAILLTGILFLVVFIVMHKRVDLLLPVEERGRVRQTAVRAFVPLLTPVVILGGILSGTVTPTEAAALGAAYMIILGVVYGELGARGILEVIYKTAETTAMIMFVIAAASIFGYVLARERIPQAMGERLLGVSDNPTILLLMITVILLVIGTFMEPTSAILVMVPVLAPIAFQIGVDPLHFGIVVVLNLMIGLLTPPVGLVLFVLSSVTDIPVKEVARGAMPFLFPLIAALLLITFFPPITMWLPEVAGFR